MRASLPGSACRRMSNSANSTWRSVCMPLWKFFAATILSNSARGSGSPVSTCAVRRLSTSHSQQKFSMNWLGSSTASHSTPEMPGDADVVDLRQHVVQAVAELVEQRDDVVVRQQRWLAVRRGGAKLHTRWATGVCRRPSGRAQRPRTSSIQAPGRLPGRAYGSR